MTKHENRYETLEEFYSFYLTQHQHPVSQRLHVFGSLLGILLVVGWIYEGTYIKIPLGLVIGYSCAWLGHFVFEKNRPATFQYPFYSFVCDFKMMKDFFSGALPERLQEALKSPPKV